MKKRIVKGICAAICAVALLVTSFTLHIPETSAVGTSSYSDIVNTADGIDRIFPESYRASLKALLAAHPNWSFQAFNTGVSWEECFQGTPGNGGELTIARNLIQKGTQASSWYSTETFSNGFQCFNWASNTYGEPADPGWAQASETAVRYCMDPRNFFNETQIFQFLKQDSIPSADDTTLIATVNTILSRVNSFWTRSGQESNIFYMDGSQKVYLTYAEAFVKIGHEIGMNPLILASRVVLEQGNGNSALISGTRTFTTTNGNSVSGYYNYFNMQATGTTTDQIITNGLREAYDNGWNTRYAALKGGAEKMRNSYVDRNQNTTYQQKFNVDGSSNRLFWGQYMTALLNPQSEAKNAYLSYNNNGLLNAGFTFIIPVFTNMPATVSPEPSGDGNPNYKLGDITVDGTTVSGFNTDQLEYSVSVGANAGEVELKAYAYASTTKITISGTESNSVCISKVSLAKGDNSIPITVTAANGSVRTYQLNITREQADIYGDVNNSDGVDMMDASLIKAYYLNRVTLTEKQIGLADVNGDGNVDMMDASLIKAYYLGRIHSLPR